MTLKGCALVILLACLQLLLPQAALAHADLARAEPAPGSVLEESPGRVAIWFTEPVEELFSEIQVLDTQGQRVDNDDHAALADDPTALSVTLRPLPKGTYTVAWQTVSSVDGHPFRGTYLFYVGQPPALSGGQPAAGEAAAAPGQPLLHSPLEPLLRWLLLLGILAVVGGLTFELAVWRPVFAGREASEPFRRMGALLAARASLVTWAAMALFLAASVGQLFLQAATLERATSVSTVLGQTDWGRHWVWRMEWAALIVAFLAARALYRMPGGRLLWNGLALTAGGGLLLSLSLVSHGAAVSGVRLEAVASDFLHLLAAAFWVGGLIHLAVGLPLVMRRLDARDSRAALSAMVPRFSTLAVLSVGALVITGLYSAWAQVTVLRAMATPYGLTLLAKVALLVPLLLLAALNLLWVRPRLFRDGRAAQWLRRFATSEAVLAALVLLAVGLLTSLEPGRQVASREGTEAHSDLNFTTDPEGARIAMTVEPGRVGPNELVVSLTDRFGRPITNASAVTAEVSYLDKDIGARSIPALGHGGGVWVAHGASLSVAGEWEASLTVRRPDAFDARAAFRFEIPAGPVSRVIAPAAGTGKLLWGGEAGLLGLLFIVVGLRVGGWRTLTGIGVMAPGVVAVFAGLFIVARAGLGGG